MKNRWISAVLMMAMLIGLLPPMTAFAAATISITNMYIGGTDTPTDQNSVTRVTQNPFKISATITGITAAEVNTMYYSIQNMSTGASTEEKTNKAAMISDNEITFNNVSLSEGLNKIIIKMGDTGSLVSAPGWVYFTPATNISDYQVSGVAWDESKIYPLTVSGNSTGLTLKGYAPNAKSVKAYLPGNGTAKNAFVNNLNYFYFPADISTKTSCDSTTDVCLKPGDNRIKFVSSNDTNSYQSDKRLIYNNGNPFAFNVTMQDTAVGENKYLVDLPSFVKKSGGIDLSISARIKNDLITPASGPTVTQYTYTDVYINGTLLTSFNNDLVAVSSNDPTSYGSITSSVTAVTYDNTAKHKYFDLTLANITDVPNFNTTANPQSVSFVFRGAGLTDVRSTYSFTFNDDTAPYVVKTSRVVGIDSLTSKDIEVQLGEGASVNEITELPAKVKIYTNLQTDSVAVAIGSGGPTTVTTFDLVDVNGNVTTDPLVAVYRVFQYTLDGLLDGANTVNVTPSMAGPVNGPLKTYNIRVTNAPYIIVTNLINNKTVESINELKCGAVNACLTGRIVNYKQGDPGNSIDVYVNDKLASIDPADIDAAYNFAFPLSRISTKYSIADVNNLLSEGKNTIKFVINVGGSPVTQASYIVFRFSTEAPSFTDIVPTTEDGNGTFTAAQTSNYFVTTSRVASFKGSYYNNVTKGGISTLSLKVTSKDSSGVLFTETHIISSAGVTPAGGNSVTSRTKAVAPFQYFVGTPSTSGVAGDNTFTFSTYDIILPDKGDIVFEFSVTNEKSQITAFRTITISRTSVPYVIKQPLLYKNDKNADQANINSNYYMVIIEAENADSVSFGKDTAVKKTELSGSIYVDRYYYEVSGLKAGQNTVSFTVNRGTQKSTGSFILYNTDTPVEGDQYLTKMSANLTAFNKEVTLKFPSGTKLKRMKPNNKNNDFITDQRQVLFGIANSTTGRVDQTNPAAVDDYASSRIQAKVTENTFRPASKLYYVDAGFISDQSTPDTTIPYLEDGMKGRGIEPFDTNATNKFFDRTAASIFIPTQRGTLTLQFDKSIRDDSWKYISVMALTVDENLSGATDISWKNLGGVVDMSKNTITVPFDRFGYYQVMYMDRGFNDITDHEYARNELEALYSRGIMNSKTTATFSPSESITRGEFAAMLVKIFDIPLNFEGNATFGDVPKIDTNNRLYNYRLVETAARAGIVRGQTNNIFSPESTLSRQDAAVMIARAADLKVNSDNTKALASLGKTFTDGNDVNYYAAPAVEAIAKAGYIEGRENVLLSGQKKATVRFDPTMDMTRADASIIAMRVMRAQKKVPK